VLVDRLWPRGVRKDALALDAWAKELLPSLADIDGVPRPPSKPISPQSTIPPAARSSPNE
jgi:hypothetical protein